MKNLFLQCFDQDLEKVEKLISAERYKTFDEKKALKIHDDLWNSLNDNQKEKYRELEMVLGEERLISEEKIYLYALKKGFAMGYEISKEFK